MDGFRALICLGSKTLSSIDIVFEYTVLTRKQSADFFFFSPKNCEY